MTDWASQMLDRPAQAGPQSTPTGVDWAAKMLGEEPPAPAPAQPPISPAQQWAAKPENTPSLARGAFDQFTSGLAMGYGPRLEAFERAILTGSDDKGFWEEYEEFLDQENAKRDAFQARAPVISTVANIAGAVAGPVGAVRSGATLARAGASTGQLAAAGAVESGIYGALHGSSADGSTEERLRAARYGAALGASIGAVSGAAAGRVQRMLSRRRLRSSAPSLDDLRAAKNSAYEAADAMGARYSSQAYDGLVDQIQSHLASKRIHPMRHPRATSMVDDLASLRGSSPTLTEVDQLRQVVARDVASSADTAEAYMGQQMIGVIDAFIDAADDAAMASGSAQGAAKSIGAAREANRALRKSEMIMKALNDAELKAAASGSGGNIQNAIKQQFSAILRSPEKSRGFSVDELAAMDDIVRGSPTENVARLLGKFAPGGNGLMAWLSLFGTATNPALVAAPVAGAIAKATAEGGTRAGVDVLRGVVAGAPPQARRALSRESAAIWRALAADTGGEIGEELAR